MPTDAHYQDFKSFAIEQFGGPVQKIAIDAGFSCPNRDGTVGKSGCTYCLNEAFNPKYCTPQKSITQQINEGIAFHEQRGRNCEQCLAYFQAFSNTHAPIEHFKKLYEEALAHSRIIGLVIGTRPDCVDPQKLDYIADLNKSHFISIEYGVESIYDKTLKRINRGHDFATARRAIEETAARDIHCGAHFIIGLPGENQIDWITGIDTINKLPINSIKFHQLQLIKGTKMVEEYRLHPEDFSAFTTESYIELMVDIIRRLRPNIVIERFAAEVPPRYLTTTPWKLQRYDTLLQSLRTKLAHDNIHQGDACNRD